MSSAFSVVEASTARRRPRPTAVSAAVVVRFLWATLPALVVDLTEAASGNSGTSSASSSSSCPKACFCNAPSRIVYCSRRGLTAVPDGIAADSLQLNLNGNVFASSTLRRGNFSGLAALEHLYLSECGIARLEVYCGICSCTTVYRGVYPPLLRPWSKSPSSPSLPFSLPSLSPPVPSPLSP